MRITLRPTRRGHYRIEYFQTQLCCLWESWAKEKGKAAARREAEATAKRYHDEMPRLLAEREARHADELKRLKASLPPGALADLRAQFSIPNADHADRDVCKLWGETEQTLRRLLNTDGEIPQASIRSAVAAVIAKVGFVGHCLLNNAEDVKTACQQVLFAALQDKFCA